MLPYKGQTLTAETHLLHDHILTRPRSAGFAALSTPQRQGGGRVRAGVGSRSSAPTRLSTVSCDAPHQVGMQVAWFLSWCCSTLWSQRSLIALVVSELWRWEAGLDWKLTGRRDHIHLLEVGTAVLVRGAWPPALTALQKLLGYQHGRARSTLSGDGSRQGHSGRPWRCRPSQQRTWLCLWSKRPGG